MKVCESDFEKSDLARLRLDKQVYIKYESLVIFSLTP